MQACRVVALTDWYCDEVLSGKRPVERVFEDERVLAFHHPRPAALPHVVVIPKLHVSSLLAPEALDGNLLVSMINAVQQTAKKIVFEEGTEWHS